MCGAAIYGLEKLEKHIIEDHKSFIGPLSHGKEFGFTDLKIRYGHYEMNMVKVIPECHLEGFLHRHT